MTFSARPASTHIIVKRPPRISATGNDRPNIVPGVSPYARVAFRQGNGAVNRQYLNLAAFAQITANCAIDPNTKIPSAASCPQLGTFGNESRNAYRGIPLYQVDAQISRIFPIHESLNLDLRLEAFNMLNHPNFNNPTANLSTGSFGQVSSAKTPRIFQAGAKISF